MARPPQITQPPPPQIVFRDQQRVRHAYECIDTVPDNAQKDYKIAVMGLGATILRNGLSAAMAELERMYKNTTNDPRLLLDHLAKAGIPGLAGATASTLPADIRKLDTDAYMLATRETLQVVLWLKRAVQAKFGEV